MPSVGVGVSVSSASSPGEDSGDTTAPAFQNVSFGGGTLDFDLIEASGAATVYWATADDGTPTNGQVIAGSGGGIYEAGSYAAEAGANSDTITITTTTPGGARLLILVAVDASANEGRAEVPITVAHLPAAMVGDTHFSVTDLGTGGDFRITLDAAPALNGGTLQRYEYRIAVGGSWATATGIAAPTDTFDGSGLTDGAATDIYMRAVTEAGNGPDGTPDSVTTTAGGAGITIAATHAQTVASAAGPTQDVAIPGTPVENDIVLVARTWDGVNDIGGVAGYTNIVNDLGSAPNLVVEYKRMGASPDSVIPVPIITGGASYVQSVLVWLLRGVHATTALDVDPVPVVAETAADNDVATPEIITVTDGAMIFRIAGLDDDAAVTLSAYPTGFDLGQLFQESGQSAGSNASIAGCAKILATAGTDVAANITFSASDEGRGATIAFRPA